MDRGPGPGGTLRLRTWLHLAWASLATAGIVADTLGRAPTDPGAWVWPFGLAPFPLAAAAILIQRPGNPIGRLFAVVGAAAGAFSAADWAATRWLDAWWSPYAESLGLIGFALVYWGLISVLYLFPTGQAPTKWSRRILLAFTVIALGVIGPGAVLSTATFEEGSGRPNPLYGGVPSLDAAYPAVLLVLALAALAGIASLIVRFRRSVGVERDQMKVFLVGAAAFVLILGLALGLPESADPTGEPAWLNVVVAAGLSALPAAIVVAILRYRLYDIDRLVSRTVTYLVVLAVLGAAYAGLVDRRFFRSRYDAGAVVARLAEELRSSSLGQEDVTAKAGAVLEEVFRPEVIGVWVGGER